MTKISRKTFIGGLAAFAAAPSFGAVREWRAGHYQIHFIYTGRSESMLHVFPDGTVMLLDCGDSMRFYGTKAEVPLPCDPKIRAGEFTARYVIEHSPKGEKVDIFHLSHLHEDHLGAFRYHGGTMGRSSRGEFVRAGLADASRFLQFGRIIDRDWPDFKHRQQPCAVSGARGEACEPLQAAAIYAHLAETQGTKIECFKLGARQKFGELDVFNFLANGRYVRRDGTVRDLFAARERANPNYNFNENAMSCGFIAQMGKFSYFSAGDFSDAWSWDGALEDRSRQAEDELAEAVGRVSVAKINHHGHHSMSAKLVSALKARAYVNCTLDQQHCTDDTMMRLADRSLYSGDRLLVPNYLPQNRPVESCGRAYLKDAAKCVVDEPCHVVLDVPPGGDTYTISCYAATRPGNPLVAEYEFVS